MAAAALAVALILAPVPSDPQPEAPAQMQLFAPKSDPLMSGSRLPYRGMYWREDQADFTRCVLERESNAHWYSTNRANGYFGAFQFNAHCFRAPERSA